MNVNVDALNADEQITTGMKRRFRMRWITIGLLLVLLAYAAYFYNHHLVYAGIAEEVMIESGGVRLAGMLVLPNTPGPHPAVVLLHGSGSNQTYDKWNYRIHTNLYLRRGFAVLSYNKRGSKDSGIDYQTVTFQDLISDGTAAVALLRNRSDIITDQIGLLGVSESGWFTPEIAARAGDIAFIVNRVSPPLPWTTVASFEDANDARAAGFSEAEIERYLALQERIWQFYIDASGDESFANGPEREAIDAILAGIEKRPGFIPAALPAYDAPFYAALASQRSYDPYPYLTGIDVPLLYVMAGRDVNVPLQASLDALEKLRREHGKRITVEIYPDAGHYLYRWELFQLEGWYVPGYLELIGAWAVQQID